VRPNPKEASAPKALVSKGIRADTDGVEAAHIAWRPLGRLLVEQGLLTNDELERALAQQQTTGKRLGETIVELGFVSGPDLASALATQYGIELTVETGFGTGLRAQIQRRHENDRGMPGPPALSIVATPPSEPESGPQADTGEQADTAEALLLTQLEEQWAKLAAAEDALVESERKITAVKHERDRRRKQAVRLVERVRSRDRQLEQPHEELGRLGRVTEEQLSEIERLTTEAENRAAELERLTGDAENRNSEIERLTRDVHDRKAEIERLTRDVQDRNAEMERLTRDVHERNAKIDGLTNDAKNRDAETERLAGNIKNRNAEIERLTNDAKDRNAEIERLTSDARSRNAEIVRLTVDVSGCDAEIERLRQENGRLRAQAGRFVARLRGGPEQSDEPEEAQAPILSSHLVFVQLNDGYELVESDGPPPPLNALLELPQFSEDDFVVTRLGRSPLPADARSCIFVQLA
jgi:outer membrane murein-binding lipoprotein Lpp